MRLRFILVFCAALATFSHGQTIAASRVTPNLLGNIDRPLRYHPDGADFVIENGGESFNRPLYGGNTAFRVDGGDKPEFVLYPPRRGGNPRLGVQAGGRGEGLVDAAPILTRHRAGGIPFQVCGPPPRAGGPFRLAGGGVSPT